MAVTARRSAPSLRPALIVVGIAVAIVVLGAVLALVGTSSARPSLVTGPSHRVAGTSVRAESAAPLIKRIARDGEPPADVTGSLLVPSGSRFVATKVLDRGVDQFDRGVSISVDLPAARVAHFFEKALASEHWVTTSVSTPSPGATEVIATRNGSDGYQWRVGVTVTPVKVDVAPALGGSSESAARSDVTVQLYQVADAS